MRPPDAISSIELSSLIPSTGYEAAAKVVGGQFGLSVGLGVNVSDFALLLTSVKGKKGSLLKTKV
jgi:hypothetical protein